MYESNLSVHQQKNEDVRYIYIYTHIYTHTIQYHATIKNENIAIYNNMGEPGSYYAK